VNNSNRCRGTTKSGAPCQSFAVEDGFCVAHSGKVDMREIGRRGGQARETALRKEVRADDELRESARQVLADALAGKKNISKSALDAARSLFAYRAQVPPVEHQGHEQREPSSRGSFNVTDLIRWSCEAGTLSQLGKDREAEAELRRIEARVVELLPIASPAEYEGGEAA
jgi:hypothetical protein